MGSILKLSQNKASQSIPRWIAFLAVFLLAGFVCALIAHTVWTYRDYPFDSDEAIHANKALAITLDLRAGDIGAAAGSFYQQGFYPPAFAIPKAIVFLISASPLTARLFSLACLLTGLLFVYGAGRQLDDRRGWTIGLIGVGLTLTSQPLLITSGLVMMEAPGLLASFATLWLHLKTLNRPTAARLVYTSLMLAVTFLTKYTYGLPIAATVVLMELSLLWPWQKGRVDSNAKRPANWLSKRAKRWFWLFGPFTLAILAWFAGPGKIDQFLSYATAQPQNWSWSLEAVVFYPRSVAIHHNPSPLFAVVTLLSVLWAMGRLRDSKLRLILIYLCIGMGEMFLNFPKNPRFIATFVPAAHLLTGAVIAWGLDQWRRASRVWLGIVTTLLVASLVTAVPVLLDRFQTYPSLMEVEYETHPGLSDLAAWIQSQIPPGERFYMVNFWDQFSPAAMAWYLGTHDPPPDTRFSEITMPSTLLQEPTPENIAALKEDIRASGVRYVVSFEGTPWGAPVWWRYADAMGDTLTQTARDVRYVDLYETHGWNKTSLLHQDEWERIKAEGQYTLQVQTTVYAVTSP